MNKGVEIGAAGPVAAPAAVAPAIELLIPVAVLIRTSANAAAFPTFVPSPAN